MADGAEQDRGGGAGGLSAPQRDVMDRCLHALKHANNDSHTLAALLLITRLCPASQLDKPTLRRIFEAVGLNLPARLLVTAVRGGDSSALPPYDLVSLGSALLAALSTDTEMASHPQLLSTVPLLLGILSNEPFWKPQNRTGLGCSPDGSGDTPTAQQTSTLDEAVAADCYQVLTAVCALPRGPDQLLSRGAVPALCQALEQNRTLSQQKGLTLLVSVLSGKTKDKAWSKHPTELLGLFLRFCTDFCQSPDPARLGMCPRLVQLLPPAGAVTESEELRGAVSRVWGALRPMLQSKLTPRQIGPVLVLSACLLDLFGWDPVGSPKFCCLLVNRACVEVRMGLEEPPGSELSPEQQHTLTGCYRIMEAAMEQACTAGGAAPPPGSSLSLQQSRQVLQVLQEAYSALMFFLQQVDPSRYGDPFVFATFRCLCSWLAEETSCLKEEVTRLLPFLMAYSQHHLQGGGSEQAPSDWVAEVSFGREGGARVGGEALRYLLPALCHLSAEEGPRKVLLSLDVPALLVDFLMQTWGVLKGRSSSAQARDPSMETASSALLNFTVTEPDRVRTDPCFRTLEAHLSEVLPVLMNKPHLLVLAANYCTLGLMIGRLKSPSSDAMEAAHRRFLSAALRCLRGALSPGWEQSWAEAAELWRLSLQALAGCVRARPGLVGLIRDEGWLKHVLQRLAESGARLDPSTEEALQEALSAVVERCPLCRQEVRDAMRRSDGAALSRMKSLARSVKES